MLSEVTTPRPAAERPAHPHLCARSFTGSESRCRAGADNGALGADLVLSSRRPMVTRGKSRWRWGAPAGDEGDAVGKAAACLWLCWAQQRGAGTTGLLPPFPLQQDQSPALRREDSPGEWCCSGPGDFPGVPAAGGVPAPQEPFSRCPAGMSAAGRAGTELTHSAQ